MRRPSGRAQATSLFLVSLCLGLPAPALGQAWLPPQGEGSVTITYQQLFSRDHLDWKGDPFDRGSVTSHSLLTGVEYGISDRLAIDVKVALVANRHQGVDSLHGPLDTGEYHGTIQDARVTLAMQVPTRGALAIAPFVGGVLPTHAYETRGHSAPGRRLRALQLGTWVGRDLGPWVPDAYVQGQYSFAFVERIGDMSINRSVADLEVGYTVSSLLTVTVAGTVHHTHGGLEFPLPRDEHFDEVFPFHDRVARDNFFLMSAGVTVAIRRNMAAFGTVIRTVTGQNTHRVTGFTAGVSWLFGRGLTLGG